MKKSVWIGVPSGMGEKFGNYFRALRAAGGVPFCPDGGGDDFACRTPDSTAFPGAAFPGAEAVPGVSPGTVIRPSDCAALLLPGGGDLNPALYGQSNTACRNLEPERDALERDLLEQFLHAGKPVLGICRGMQSLNVFLGGTLFQDIPGHTPVDGPGVRPDRLHSVRTAPGPFADLFRNAGFLSGETDLLTVNSSHHQAVERLGAGLDAVQWGPGDVVEAVVHRTLPVWGVQWHPERADGHVGEPLFQAFLDLCQ